jgi:hypothetical protein
MNQTAPKLQAPGAGLPPIDAFVARYILFPLQSKSLSREKAIKDLIETGQICVSLVENLPAAQQKQQILIPPQRGLEDSSRFWSAMMTLNHLLITGIAMRDMIIALSQGQKPTIIVRTQDVKPAPETAQTITKEYKNFLDTYKGMITPLNDLKNPAHTHKHPWFGELTAHQWLALNATHTKIHLQQIREIIKRLEI